MVRLSILVFLVACGGKSAPPPAEPAPVTSPVQPPGGDCVKSGCSGTSCVEPGQEVVTTCEYKPEYACYQQASCTRQGDGKCGWTQTPELAKCLASPPIAP
jgi:hypothetical protein